MSPPEGTAGPVRFERHGIEAKDIALVDVLISDLKTQFLRKGVKRARNSNSSKGVQEVLTEFKSTLADFLNRPRAVSTPLLDKASRRKHRKVDKARMDLLLARAAGTQTAEHTKKLSDAILDFAHGLVPPQVDLSNRIWRPPSEDGSESLTEDPGVQSSYDPVTHQFHCPTPAEAAEADKELWKHVTEPPTEKSPAEAEKLRAVECEWIDLSELKIKKVDLDKKEKAYAQAFGGPKWWMADISSCSEEDEDETNSGEKYERKITALPLRQLKKDKGKKRSDDSEGCASFVEDEQDSFDDDGDAGLLI